MGCSRRSAASTGSMATTRTTATSSTTATCSTRSSAITDYTPAPSTATTKQDIDGLLKDRMEKAREDLDEALERIRAICEPVAPPKNTLQYQQYFCAAEQGNAEQLKANEPKRVELYKAVAAVTRAYANLANEMADAGYSDAEAAAIKEEIAHYASVRDEVKLGAGENVDFKQYEAGHAVPARHLHPGRRRRRKSRTSRTRALFSSSSRWAPVRIDKLPKGIRVEPRGRGRDDHQQHAQGHHRRARDEPEVLRQDVRAARCADQERRKRRLDYKEYLEKLIDQAERLGKASRTSRTPMGRQRRQAGPMDFGWPDPDTALVIDATSCIPNRIAGSATR